MLALSAAADGHPGDLDPSFGGDGFIAPPLSPSVPADVVADPGGGILLVGADYVGSVLVRLRPNGRVDRGFATSGTARLPGIEGPTDLELGPDGRFVVGGTTSNSGGGSPAVGRLTPDGEPDLSFGDQGVARVDLEQSAGSVEALAVQPDGKILVAALGPSNGAVPFTPSRRLAVARLQVNGMPDPAFGSDGVMTMDAGPGLCSIADLVVQSDGSLVVEGGAALSNGNLGSPCPDGDLRLIRLGTDGAPDSAFGTDGIASFDFGYAEVGRGLTVDTTDRILAMGMACRSDGCTTQLMRVDGQGRLDPSFGAGGQLAAVSRPSEGVTAPTGFASTSGDAIYTVASRYKGEFRQWDLALTRLDASGSPDLAFARRGTAISDLTLGYDYAFDVTVDAQGRAIVTTVEGTIARFLAAAGPHDRDADGTRDRRDRCLSVFGPGDGCVRMDREVSLFRTADGLVTGEVRSAVGGCRNEVPLEVLRPEQGRDRVLARGRTGNQGSWEFNRPFSGELYARVRKLFQPGIGYCRTSRSRVLEADERSSRSPQRK